MCIGTAIPRRGRRIVLRAISGCCLTIVNCPQILGAEHRLTEFPFSVGSRDFDFFLGILCSADLVASPSTNFLTIL
jgi:hypothetical protein